MDVKLFREVGVHALVGVAVFGWIFSQSPLPEQLKAPKSVDKPAALKQVGKRTDQIPSVPQPAPKEIKIEIQPVALQTPDQLLNPSQAVLEVIATNLKMRTGPSSATELIDVYKRGSTFEQIGQNGKWLQVRSTEDGTSGWMFSDYLRTAN